MIGVQQKVRVNLFFNKPTSSNSVANKVKGRTVVVLPILRQSQRMKNIKQQFLTAVRILAPENDLILKLAQRIPEEQLPAYPGAAALEFVATLEKFSPIRCLPIGWVPPVSPPSRRRCRAGRLRQAPPGHRRVRYSGAHLAPAGEGSPHQITTPLLHHPNNPSIH
jgi:hypothetical protein